MTQPSQDIFWQPAAYDTHSPHNAQYYHTDAPQPPSYAPLRPQPLSHPQPHLQPRLQSHLHPQPQPQLPHFPQSHHAPQHIPPPWPPHVQSCNAHHHPNVYAQAPALMYGAPDMQQSSHQESNVRQSSYVPNAPEPPFVCNMSRNSFIRACALYLDRRSSFNAHYVLIPGRGERAGVFFSVTAPAIATEAYIERLVSFAQCSSVSFVVMLTLLDRVSDNNPSLHVTPRSLHRLLTTALTLASKLLDDRCFPNAHYAKVGGVPSTEEMNRLELAFLFESSFRLHVTMDDFSSKMKDLHSMLIPTSPRSVFDFVPESSSPALGRSYDPYSTPAPSRPAPPPRLRPSPAPPLSSARLNTGFVNDIDNYKDNYSKQTLAQDRPLDSSTLPIMKVYPTSSTSSSSSMLKEYQAPPSSLNIASQIYKGYSSSISALATLKAQVSKACPGMPHSVSSTVPISRGCSSTSSSAPPMFKSISSSIGSRDRSNGSWHAPSFGAGPQGGYGFQAAPNAGQGCLYPHG